VNGAKQPVIPAPVGIDARQQGTGGRIEIVPRVFLVIQDDAIDRQLATGADEIGVGLADQPLFCDAVRAGKTRCRRL
jgi:hypothetical protein